MRPPECRRFAPVAAPGFAFARFAAIAVLACRILISASWGHPARAFRRSRAPPSRLRRAASISTGDGRGSLLRRRHARRAATMDERDDPIVYLATVANEPLASLYADVLQAAGIRTMAKPRGPGYGAWASAATLEHDLYVLRSRLPEAEAIVRELEAETDDAPGDADDE
jgi:hypothetical protein